MERSIIKAPECLQCNFNLAVGIIYIEVMLGRKKTNFLFDTGASTTILNKKYLKDKDLLDTTGKFGGISGSGTYYYHRIKKMKWQNLEIQHKRLRVIDMAHLERQLGITLHGLLGSDFMRDYTLMIDYKNKTIDMWQFFIDAPFKIIKTTPFIMYKHIPVLEVNIGNTSLKLGIDSGASSNLINLKHKNKLKNHLVELRSGSLSGGDKKVQQVTQYKMKELFCNQVSYKNMAFIFTQFDHLQKQIGPFDGLLGYEFLKKRKVAINFRKEELYYVRKK